MNREKNRQYILKIMVQAFFLVFVLGILFGMRTQASGMERVRVIILPFSIYAKDNVDYLKTEIPKNIAAHLKNEGAVIVEPEYPPGVSPTDPSRQVETMRRIGIESGADYIIWGSMTLVGTRFSLDARMLKTFEDIPPATFYVDAKTMENLPSVIQDLARNFSMKLFKRERVVDIRVEGNRRIDRDAIKKRIETKPGDVFLAKSLSRDLKSVHQMGFFENIRIESQKTPQGKIITFYVEEKPTIKNIQVRGNNAFDDEEIIEELSIETGAILNINEIQRNLQAIETLYRDKNYHNVAVSYQVHKIRNNQADIEFVVDEGEKLMIREIRFAGNQAFSNEKLKKLMKTSEKGFWSWLTSSGELNREDLNQDVAKIRAFYHNNGYILARVGEPQVNYKDNWITIEIKIEEGPRFAVGEVDIEGDIAGKKEELKEKLKITEEKFYNREVIRNDILALSDVYYDKGYAAAEITPEIDQIPPVDENTPGKVNITYNINKGQKVTFEKIIITGNVKTRDKVIRRQLHVHEQEYYSGRKLKRSIRNLNRLDYFEDVRVTTEEGSAKDKIVLNIDVKEKPTGTFSFGGGYSSVENLFAMASIQQRNLFGRGQILQLKAEVGGSTNRYTISFTEPYLFDKSLSAGFDLYNWEREYDTYDKDSKGGGLRLGFPVFDYTRMYFSYSYDIGNIENVDEDASDLVKEMTGENVTSSISTSLRYDSRDRIFNPTEGMDHGLTFQYAGLGGDIAFTKYIAESGVYIPLVWDVVGFLHGEGGYVTENSGGSLPDYERFYLGGMNSLRGFDWREISSYDENGDEIGGNKYIQFNAEVLIPLVKKAGVVGVIFFDTGNVFKEGEEIEVDAIRESAGFGFRWYSPMGPIRIENGYILDPKEGESSGGRWEFTMGGAF